MSTHTRASGHGTIRKAAESADEIIVKMRFDHGNWDWGMPEAQPRVHTGSVQQWEMPVLSSGA
eukprot:scaffold59856_cov92-Attheya_sp.AAC.3